VVEFVPTVVPVFPGVGPEPASRISVDLLVLHGPAWAVELSPNMAALTRISWRYLFICFGWRENAAIMHAGAPTNLPKEAQVPIYFKVS